MRGVPTLAMVAVLTRAWEAPRHRAANERVQPLQMAATTFADDAGRVKEDRLWDLWKKGDEFGSVRRGSARRCDVRQVRLRSGPVPHLLPPVPRRGELRSGRFALFRLCRLLDRNRGVGY